MDRDRRRDAIEYASLLIDDALARMPYAADETIWRLVDAAAIVASELLSDDRRRDRKVLGLDCPTGRGNMLIMDPPKTIMDAIRLCQAQSVERTCKLEIDFGGSGGERGCE